MEPTAPRSCTSSESLDSTPPDATSRIATAITSSADAPSLDGRVHHHTAQASCTEVTEPYAACSTADEVTSTYSTSLSHPSQNDEAHETNKIIKAIAITATNSMAEEFLSSAAATALRDHYSQVNEYQKNRTYDECRMIRLNMNISSEDFDVI